MELGSVILVRGKDHNDYAVCYVQCRQPPDQAAQLCDSVVVWALLCPGGANSPMMDE